MLPQSCLLRARAAQSPRKGPGMLPTSWPRDGTRLRGICRAKPLSSLFELLRTTARRHCFATHFTFGLQLQGGRCKVRAAMVLQCSAVRVITTHKHAATAFQWWCFMKNSDCAPTRNRFLIWVGHMFNNVGSFTRLSCIRMLQVHTGCEKFGESNSWEGHRSSSNTSCFW